MGAADIKSMANFNRHGEEKAKNPLSLSLPQSSPLFVLRTPRTTITDTGKKNHCLGDTGGGQ